MTNESEINGTLLRHQRESMGWTLADMAARACLSTKQIKQLEDGGDSAFYSPSIKLNVAKKVALILGVTDDELFCRIKTPKSSTSLESIEDIEAEQLALLASFESDPVADEVESVYKVGSDTSGLKAPSPQVENTSNSAAQEENQNSQVQNHPDLDSDQSHQSLTPALSPSLDKPRDITSTVEPLATAMDLKAPSQELRSESMAPNFLSNADSHMTEEPSNSNSSHVLMTLLLALLVFAALLVLFPDFRNNVSEVVHQFGFLEPDGTPAATQSSTLNPPAVDANQRDTPLESAANTASSSKAASSSPVSVPAASLAPTPSQNTKPTNSLASVAPSPAVSPNTTPLPTVSNNSASSTPLPAASSNAP